MLSNNIFATKGIIKKALRAFSEEFRRGWWGGGVEWSGDELEEEIAVLFFMWNTCFHDKWNICPSGPVSLECCVLTGPFHWHVVS